MHCHWTLSVHEAHTFPQASVSESCLHLGTDHIPGQISVHIFPPNRGYCFYIEYDHNRVSILNMITIEPRPTTCLDTVFLQC